jgi:hypothetical protein
MDDTVTLFLFSVSKTVESSLTDRLKSLSKGARYNLEARSKSLSKCVGSSFTADRDDRKRGSITNKSII